CDIIRKVRRGATAVDEKKALFAEILATYIDNLLKAEGQSAAGDDAARAVRDFGVLFSFVQDKDIFGEHFKLRLAKRLLMTKYNEDMELQVLEQMQRQSGKHFIHKFEGMINDVRNAINLQEQFKNAKVGA